MKQTDRILRHMEDYGAITAAEAMSEYGIYRLAARISDLRHDGYDIVSERVTGRNRYGEKVTIARYSLEREDESTCN